MKPLSIILMLPCLAFAKPDENTSAPQGCFVGQVRTGSAAETAGLKVGDIIIEANHTPIRSGEDLQAAVKAARRDFPLVVRRGSSTENLAATLARGPLGYRLGVGCQEGSSPAFSDKLLGNDNQLGGSQALSLYGGFGYSPTSLNFQTSGSDRISDYGGAFGGQYTYSLRSMSSLSLGLDISYSRLGEHPSTQLLTNLDTHSDARSLIGLAIAKWRFRGDGSVHRYLFAGAGLHRTAFHLDAQPAPGLHWINAQSTEFDTSRRTLIESSATTWAAATGFGMDIDLSDHFFVGAEFRATLLGKATYDPSSEGAAVVSPISGGFFLWNGFLRLGFRFSGHAAGSPSDYPNPA